MKFKLDELYRQTSCRLAAFKQSVLLGKFWTHLGHPLIWSSTLALGWGTALSPVVAAEQVTLRLGPLEQTIAIEDLAEFAKTGELSSSLQLYAPVLTAQVRDALNRRLQIDPNLADELIDDWLGSPRGKQLIAALGSAIPDGTLPQIQATIAIAARQANGLSLVSFLRAYPEENITLDLSSALAIALEFNPTYLRSSALGPWLESKLAVERDTSFKPSFDPSRLGSQAVQQQTLTFHDRQRHRTILVDLYFPSRRQQRAGGVGGSGEDRVDRGVASKSSLPPSLSSPALVTRSSPSPLVVISPGLGANRRFLAYLAQHLASHGLTVAALEHPANNSNWLASASAGSKSTQMLLAKEFVERPQDVSFVLDELAKLNQQRGLLQGKLNTQQVSAIGHSLGGYTALALAGAEVNLSLLRQFCKNANAIAIAPADWLQCAAADLPQRKFHLRDRRVKSAIALNPVVGHIFGKTGLSQVATPVLLLASTEDTITPLLDHQLRPFTQLRSPKYLLTAIGGTHLSISDAVNLPNAARNSTFVKERRGEATKSLRQLLQGVSLAFIKQLTPEAKIYTPFLTSTYAESLSTPALPLRLNTELPASITSLIRG
jgi:predicted dienelactone hydrolase